MSLQIAALAALPVVFFAAAALLYRHLPRASGPRRGDMVCLHCGTPAGWLASFVCPTCNQDVRQVGVGPARPPGGVNVPFWLAAAFTAVLSVAVFLVTIAVDDESAGPSQGWSEME